MGDRFGVVQVFAPEYIPLLSNGLVKCVSSDESDREGRGDVDEHGNPLDCVYTVNPVWRSLEYGDWQHSIDQARASLRERKVGNRAIPGTNPRTRIYTKKVNEDARCAPEGLPENCYNEVSVFVLNFPYACTQSDSIAALVQLAFSIRKGTVEHGAEGYVQAVCGER